MGLDLLAGAALPVEVGDLQKTWPSSQVPEPRNQTPSPRFRQLHLVELKGTFVGLARCSRRLLGDSSRSWAGGGLPWSQEEAEPLCHGGHRPAPSADKMGRFHKAWPRGENVVGTAGYQGRFRVLGGLDQVLLASSAS